MGGDENELAVAQCFAAALARLVDGAVFDPQEGCLQTVEQAIDHAKKQIAGMAPKSKVRGTRPADIKHYLKPLLQMRSDLVLVDRQFVNPAGAASDTGCLLRSNEQQVFVPCVE